MDRSVFAIKLDVYSVEEGETTTKGRDRVEDTRMMKKRVLFKRLRKEGCTIISLTLENNQSSDSENIHSIRRSLPYVRNRSNDDMRELIG